MNISPRLASLLVLALVVPVGAAVALGSPAHAVTKVSLDFDKAKKGATIRAPRNRGSALTEQRVLSVAYGTVTARRSGIGTGRVAQFPSFDGAVEGQRAVIAITNAGRKDRITPRSRAFSFGATVRLDPVSAGSAWDDGNNLVQRGLEGQRAQFKVEIDKRRPSCRVQGSAGAAEVRLSERIDVGRWYAVVCRRKVIAAGDQLVLKVVRIKADGTRGARVVDRSAVVPIGRLRFGRRIPLSVGGKLTDATTIERRSDQFNGRLDDVFLKVARRR